LSIEFSATAISAIVCGFEKKLCQRIANLTFYFYSAGGRGTALIGDAGV
jgi:hypothetical protein